MGETGVDLAFEKYEEYCEINNKAKLPYDEFKNIAKAVFKYQELSEKIEENRVFLKNVEMSQAVRIDLHLSMVDEKINASGLHLIGEDILLPQTTKNLDRWEQEGIVVYLRSAGISEESLDTIKMDLVEECSGTEGYEKVIFGGDISGMPAENLSECITLIEDYLYTEHSWEGDISQWLRKGI